MRRLAAGRVATASLLAVIALAALALRLWNNDFGLPYVFNVDERTHFASHAVEMVADGTLDPGYFQNPSGFTYLVFFALRLTFEEGSLARSFAADPTAVFELARDLAALLGTAGVVAVFFLGRRLAGARGGLTAAAILGAAFLAVAYSRLALTDVGTLAPVALCLLGCLLVLDSGRRRDWALAGAAAGLAIGFKYTAGLVLLPVAIAGGVRLLRARDRRALVGAAVGGTAVVAAFLLTTPYLLLQAGEARGQLASQAAAAGSPKLGQGGEWAVIYYLDSLTWGFGWLPLAAALAGAVVLARRDRAHAAVLVAFPLALVVYLSLQERFFGRWLLPMYPALAALAAVALTAAAEWIAARMGRNRSSRRARAILPGLLLAGLCLLVLAQPLAADWRSGRLLARADTRVLARAWLSDQAPPRLRAVVEPEVPPAFYEPAAGGPPLFMRHFEREARARRQHYSDTLSPATLERYRASGYCTLVTLSYVRGRVERDLDPGAIDYYRRLERESRLVYRASPTADGSPPDPFHFDLSYNGYPRGLARPGPEVRVLVLDRCRQGYGPLTAAERSAIRLRGAERGRDRAAARGGRGGPGPSS